MVGVTLLGPQALRMHSTVSSELQMDWLSSLTESPVAGMLGIVGEAPVGKVAPLCREAGELGLSQERWLKVSENPGFTMLLCLLLAGVTLHK